MRRVSFALLGMAVLLTALIVFISSGQAGIAAGRGALAVFFSVLTIGLPSLYYCCERGLREAWRYALLGALAGLLCALPLHGGPYLFGFLLLIFVAGGAALGASFWFAAIWRNPALLKPGSVSLPDGTTYRVVPLVGKRQSK